MSPRTHLAQSQAQCRPCYLYERFVQCKGRDSLCRVQFCCLGVRLAKSTAKHATITSACLAIGMLPQRVAERDLGDFRSAHASHRREVLSPRVRTAEEPLSGIVRAAREAHGVGRRARPGHPGQGAMTRRRATVPLHVRPLTAPRHVGRVASGIRCALVDASAYRPCNMRAAFRVRQNAQAAAPSGASPCPLRRLVFLDLAY